MPMKDGTCALLNGPDSVRWAPYCVATMFLMLETQLGTCPSIYRKTMVEWSLEKEDTPFSELLE